MKLRSLFAVGLVIVLLGALPGSAGRGAPLGSGRDRLRDHPALPDGFIPAAALTPSALGRYYVVMRAPAVADRARDAAAQGVTLSADDQRAAFANARASQQAAVDEAESLGGTVVFRYGRLVNAFSARLSTSAAAAMVRRPDVASVQPVTVVKKLTNESTAFIGAPEVWDLGFRGEGMRVALVDTGIDYTHADFGGPGTPEAYDENDPAIIEPGTFPTAKVIGGYDLVGQDYDVLDGNPSNDMPVPDPDPLDSDGHGSHTGGTCCGIGVAGEIQRGVAPLASLYSFKVWDEGNSTDDVLVAAYELAVDPNQDGDTTDRADVLSFSGGVDYGTQNSVEAVAAQGVVDLGTVFVASAGNAGNQGAGGSAYVSGTPANAPGVISVAADAVEFVAASLVVNDPPGTVLPDGGIVVAQSWGAPLDAAITTDLFDAREVDPPADPGNPAPTDQMLCEELPGTPLAGKFALIYKGSTGEGDCGGSLKAYNAELAGASGVLFWSGFAGAAFDLGWGGEPVTIPVIMATTADSEVLGDAVSPDASSGTFNTGVANVTIGLPAPVPGYADSMADFSSEGPARVTNILKPDITAPGVDIVSAGVGTGDQGALLSGTSMAAPHVSGVATLLRQIHPDWSVERIKAALMNNATLDLKNTDLSSPVAATVMGAGRVQADVSALAVSLATPPSLSFGLQPLASSQRIVQSMRVTNTDTVSHTYRVSGNVRYADYDPSVAHISVSLNGTTYGKVQTFTVAPGKGRQLFVGLTLDPAGVSEAEQEFGWYYFHPGVDGEVFVREAGAGGNLLHVPWHTVLLASAASTASPSVLDLTGGHATLTVGGPASAGAPGADLYLLGGFGDKTTGTEEDIAATGARSFTGSSIDGVGVGLPTGTDALAGITWTQFLTAEAEPLEPVEFGVQFYAAHDTTESLEVDVLVDAGADGVFADPGMRADYLVVKPPGPGGMVCVYDLSLPSPYDACSATYFADYSNYNANIVGLPVDAGAIGLTTAASDVAYQVKACTGRFSGDVPSQVCDTLGDFDGTTYTSRLRTTKPSLLITPLVCGGFWGDRACSAGDPATVAVGAARPGDNPSILVLFPNNPPTSGVTVIRTTT